MQKHPPYKRPPHKRLAYQRRKTPPQPWKRRRKRRVCSWPINRWTPPHKRLPHKRLFQQRLKPHPQPNILVSNARYLSAPAWLVRLIYPSVSLPLYGISAPGATGTGCSMKMCPTNISWLIWPQRVDKSVSGALISKSHHGSQITANGVGDISSTSCFALLHPSLWTPM